jgi:hypothetical protein
MTCDGWRSAAAGSVVAKGRGDEVGGACGVETAAAAWKVCGIGMLALLATGAGSKVVLPTERPAAGCRPAGLAVV